jgi:hypothetical protein
MVTDERIEAVSAAWIRFNATQEEKDEWVLNPVAEWIDEGRVDVVWRLVLALCAEVDEGDLSMIANIGAGPLEEMIVKFGDTAVDLIEPAVNANPNLLKALAAVWRFDMPQRPRIDRILAAHGQDPL